MDQAVTGCFLIASRSVTNARKPGTTQQMSNPLGIALEPVSGTLIASETGPDAEDLEALLAKGLERAKK